jgi:hypothetical protein
MDAEGNHAALTDPSLDSDLQALLAVEPSPEFVPRVRTRVANEPEPRAWWLWWTVAGVVTAAAVLLTAAYITRPREIASPAQVAKHVPERPAEAKPQVQARPDAQPNAASDLSGTVSNQATKRQMTSGQRATGPRADSQPASSQPPAADVLLDPRESAALRALIAGVSTGAVDLEPVLRASAPSAMDLPPIADIVIAPITIAPIVEEGARQ